MLTSYFGKKLRFFFFFFCPILFWEYVYMFILITAVVFLPQIRNFVKPPNRNSQLYFPWVILCWLIVKVNITVINNSEFYCVRSQKLFYSRKHHLQKQPIFPCEGLLLIRTAKPLCEENISASLSGACHVAYPAAVVRDFSQQSLLICINRSIACLSFIVTSNLMPKSLLSL